ncbi:hypothetical protein [Nocardioides daeguensis]|uniref:DUF4386 domain-containing protein n=1 Tax=Nocardioides daeguensis TaxID=908359 RepID=A0ABP6UW91_9ACTN|nr:hypothetical protein [Nocardioides daeguensis]MBV6725559.1 hypothetical protein [Nocardioides daeguensis]MCR1771419.1 hypothetical protein [Nocardioides daeguensis]
MSAASIVEEGTVQSTVPDPASAAAGDPGLRVLAVAGVAGVALILSGMLVSGYIPAPGAAWSPERIQEFYAGAATQRRLGIFLMILGTPLFGALVAGMSRVLVLGGGNRGGWANLQTVVGGCGTVLLVLFAMVLAVAAYRPERDAEITQALHDLGWYFAFISAVPFVIQALAIAWVVLRSGVLPRQFGWANLSVAILLLPGAAMLFFHTGPVAYDGLLTFWVPLTDFGLWMLLLAWGMWVSADRDAVAGERR